MRSVDPLFLQAYVPRLMTSFQVVRFLLNRGHPIPSPVVLGRSGRAYVDAIDAFAERHAIPVLRFGKRDSKEQIARAISRRPSERSLRRGADRRRAGGGDGLARWRHGGRAAIRNFEFGRQQVFVNHCSFYVRDPKWGPAFIKTCPSAPFPTGCMSTARGKRQALRAAGVRGAR